MGIIIGRNQIHLHCDYCGKADSAKRSTQDEAIKFAEKEGWHRNLSSGKAMCPSCRHVVNPPAPKTKVAPTVESIRKMAEVCRREADLFDRIANRMEESGDITIASEAISEAVNLIPQLRIDLLVTRPLREFTLKG